jgi:acyl carrier protein
MKETKTMASVYERIRQLTINQLKIKDDSVTAVSSLSDLGADSLDIVELIMAVEKEFSTPEKTLSIPDEEMEKMATVQDIVEFVKKQGFTDHDQAKKPEEKPERHHHFSRYRESFRRHSHRDHGDKPAQPVRNEKPAVDSNLPDVDLDTSELINNNQPANRGRRRYYRRYSNKSNRNNNQ